MRKAFDPFPCSKCHTMYFPRAGRLTQAVEKVIEGVTKGLPVVDPFTLPLAAPRVTMWQGGVLLLLLPPRPGPPWPTSAHPSHLAAVLQTSNACALGPS